MSDSSNVVDVSKRKIRYDYATKLLQSLEPLVLRMEESIKDMQENMATRDDLLQMEYTS